MAQPFDGPIVSASMAEDAASYLVREAVTRTASLHGLSPAEVKRISEAGHFIEGRGGSIFVTVEPGIDDPDVDVCRLGDKIKNHVVTFQRRKGWPTYWLEVLEPTPRLHIHMVVSAPRGQLRRLLESLTESSLFGDHVNAQRVHDMPGLANYLSKSATPQAQWRRGFRRAPGPHRMESDRVRLRA